MSAAKKKLGGPDFAKGVAVSSVVEGAALLRYAHGESVLLAPQGDGLFAVGASCTHYGGPLAEGLIVGDTIRCPWHHACFSLRTGEALCAPALKPVSCWHVEQRKGKPYVGKRVKPAGPPSPPAKGAAPRSVVILDGGAAGNAAAEMLRREGYTGQITMLSADAPLPCDRPSLLPWACVRPTVQGSPEAHAISDRPDPRILRAFSHGHPSPSALARGREGGGGDPASAALGDRGF